ncbi:MAG: Uma2 family endonuclease [Blastocatellia bacterium]
MSVQMRFTSRDLESMPDDGKRYEIVDGELIASKQPHYYHQRVCSNLCFVLESWIRGTGSGQVSIAPGLIFADDDDVAPDIVWLSTARLSAVLSEDGKLHAAPELVVEVLSPGANYRDREAKLKLYSRRGVDEYWIVDWKLRRMEIYRRERTPLELAVTLQEGDEILSPLLPCFRAPLESIFNGLSSN